jgi:drug/metabolite transporter (DMT)-like permease
MSNTSQKQEESKPTHQPVISAGIWFAIICWGGAYVAGRYLLHPETAGQIALSPALLAALRFSIAGLFFIVPLGRAIKRRKITARQLLLLALLGQLTFSLYYWLQYIGIQQTDASIAAILGVGLIPLFTTLLAPIFGEEKFHLSLLTVLLLGFAGVVLVALQQPLSVSLQTGFLLGVVCLVSNTFFFAIYSHLSKSWMREISPLVLTSGTMVSGALGLVILSFFDPVGDHWNTVVQLNTTQWLALLFLAVGCSVMAYFAYNVALSKRDASRVTIYFYLEPVVTVVLGVALLGEQLNWQIIVGGIAIFTSVVMVHLMKRQA